MGGRGARQRGFRRGRVIRRPAAGSKVKPPTGAAPPVAAAATGPHRCVDDSRCSRGRALQHTDYTRACSYCFLFSYR